MLEQCSNKEDRFAGVQKIINQWLEARQELVVSYCSVSGISQTDDLSGVSIKKLQQFCQLLIDYISAGHFEVYDQLLKEAEAFNDNSAALVRKVYPAITETTDIALNFHEIYDTEQHCAASLSRLKDELSTLGEAISKRFSLEDELIAELHDSHAALIGQQFESAQIIQH
ncbi:MAG: sigma D regulator [Pseudomonadales bacterium]|nr:sigma D regulator [Pseudomonadales bacterium]